MVAFRIAQHFIEKGDMFVLLFVAVAVHFRQEPSLPRIGELVAAEGTLLIREPLEAAVAGHVGALQDCGIRVGEFFQADATLRLLGAERGQYESANVFVSHCFVRAPKGDFPILNDF